MLILVSTSPTSCFMFLTLTTESSVAPLAQITRQFRVAATKTVTTNEATYPIIWNVQILFYSNITDYLNNPSTKFPIVVVIIGSCQPIITKLQVCVFGSSLTNNFTMKHKNICHFVTVHQKVRALLLLHLIHQKEFLCRFCKAASQSIWETDRAGGTR